MLSLSARAKAEDKSLFLAELTYAAIVSAPGTDRDDLNPLIMIEAPRLMFPFARAIISDMTRDGGFMRSASSRSISSRSTRTTWNASRPETARIPARKPDGKDGSAVPDRILQFFKKRKVRRLFGVTCIVRPVET